MAIPSPDFLFSSALLFIGLVWVKRSFWMRRFQIKQPPLRPETRMPAEPPFVSVVVPARNEEKNIVNCLRRLLDQNYPRFEIIVVDDRSDDATSDRVRECRQNAAADVHLVRIDKLPPGWTGKNYAMFTGSKKAAGEWILFTDADTTHGRTSLLTAVATALDRRIDLLTLSPEVESKSFWEKTVQPLAVSSLALWFDPEKVNDPRGNVVLANGQYLLIRKAVYEEIGGNESVREEVVEDVELAKRVRAAGYLVQFLNGTLLYSTRMYTSLREIRTGWTRILTYLFNKDIPALAHKIFLFIFFSCFPYAVFFWEIFACLARGDFFSPVLFFLSLGVCLEITVIRYFGNRTVKSSPAYAVLHPLGSCVLIWILSCCIARIALRRKSVWRGQYYR